MTQPFLVKPAPGKKPVALDELIALLGPAHLDRIEQQARIMRETYTCPFTAQNYDAFKEILFDFFAHYQKTFFNADLKQAAGADQYWRHAAYDFAQQHLGGYKGDLRTAERNAIAGREGGMIAVIDALTEGIIKLHTKTYVQAVFFELIEPSDYPTRLRLAEQLLKKYGPFLFPGEEILPYYILGGNLEELINGFVARLHPLRRDWRY